MSTADSPAPKTSSSAQDASPRGLSLRILLVLSFTGLISLSALISGGILTWQQFQSERTSTIHSLSFRSETIAKEITDLMASLITTLQTTAHYHHPHGGTSNHLDISHAMTHILGQFKGLQTISILDRTGREIDKVSRILTTNELAYQDYQGTALWSAILKKEDYLGLVSISKHTKSPVVYIAIPLIDGGNQIQGAIVGELNLRFLWGALSKLQLEPGHAAYVIDRQGRVLGHSLLVQVLRGLNLDQNLTADIFTSIEPFTVHQTTNFDGQPVLMVSVVLDEYGWATVYEIPQAQANLPAFHSAIISSVVLIFSAIFAAVIGWLLARHLTRPLDHFAKTATKIAEGDFSTHLPDHGTQEIHRLSSAFNTMTTQLEVAMADLSQAKEKAERQSLQDGLTGLANRRRVDQYLDREWYRSMRLKSDLSIILMDIDFFKMFNDNYGHSAGDECLKQVAKLLSGAVARGTDLVARHGGEEFICVLPDTNEKGARLIADAIREKIVAANIPHAYSQVADHVTLSFGVATAVPTVSSSSLQLINRADQALYEAKNQGRNKVVTHTEISGAA